MRAQERARLAKVESLERETKELQARDRRRRIGVLIAAGECENARTEALTSGDLELAVQVQALCGKAGTEPAR